LAGDVRQDAVSILQFHHELGVGERLDNASLCSYGFLFGHADLPKSTSAGPVLVWWSTIGRNLEGSRNLPHPGSRTEDNLRAAPGGRIGTRENLPHRDPLRILDPRGIDQPASDGAPGPPGSADGK